MPNETNALVASTSTTPEASTIVSPSTVEASPAFNAADTSKSNVAVKPRKPAAKADATKAAAAAKPAKLAAATATEAKPDPRVAAAERLAADRVSIEAVYAAFDAHRLSIPVKPFSGSTKPEATTAHPVKRNPSLRQAAAIAAVFAAAGRKLNNGTSAPRVFTANGVRVFAENGVLRDIVSSGLATVSGDTPETEIVTLRNANAVIGMLGEKLCKSAGILPIKPVKPSKAA